MIKRVALWTVAAAVLLLTGWLVYERLLLSEEVRLRRLISTMKKTLEKGNVLKLTDYIAQDYEDEWGLNKSTLIATLREVRMNYRDVRISITEMRVKVEDDRAEVSLIATATATDRANMKVQLTDEIPAQTSDRFRLKFRKTPDGWKLQRVENIKLWFD